MNSPKRVISIWLLSGCFLIFCMVIIGGITRLTGSGLSITEWKPIMGAIPPMNDKEWEDAFSLYRQIPQFEKINSHFTLVEFKSIFWWEYAHRLLGRIIGLVFVIPFLWFYFRGMFDNKTIRKALFLFFLGALQGVVGWLMVKSGLTERTSVSHIRLAIHLLTAFITFGFTFYFALELLTKKPQSAGRFSGYAITLFFLVTLQIIYGAFVAGLHAGKMYNTYPLMNGNLIPEGLFYLDPDWINFFDNPVMIQFIHRMLAAIIVLFTFFIWFKWKYFQLNEKQKRGIKFFSIALGIQFLLGVFTLLTGVDITLALLHQGSAFMLFSSCVYLIFIS